MAPAPPGSSTPAAQNVLAWRLRCRRRQGPSDVVERGLVAIDGRAQPMDSPREALVEIDTRGPVQQRPRLLPIGDQAFHLAAAGPQPLLVGHDRDLTTDDAHDPIRDLADGD